MWVWMGDRAVLAARQRYDQFRSFLDLSLIPEHAVELNRFPCPTRSFE
jgi:hypothetical protein